MLEYVNFTKHVTPLAVNLSYCAFVNAIVWPLVVTVPISITSIVPSAPFVTVYVMVSPSVYVTVYVSTKPTVLVFSILAIPLPSSPSAPFVTVNVSVDPFVYKTVYVSISPLVPVFVMLAIPLPVAPVAPVAPVSPFGPRGSVILGVVKLVPSANVNLKTAVVGVTCVMSTRAT